MPQLLLVYFVLVTWQNAAVGQTIGTIPGFRFERENQLYVFQDLFESELAWATQELQCDLATLNQCTLDDPLECVQQSHCQRLLSAPFRLRGNMDETDCIVECTEYCKKTSPRDIDQCFSDCLKRLC